MRNIKVRPHSVLRRFFPVIQKLRRWAYKVYDRGGQRLVVSGGAVQFLDATLVFPEDVGLVYSTPLLWNGPYAYEPATSRAIASLLGRSKLFFDIGSNIGIYSVYAGVKHPAVTTFAFEPVPSIWEKNRAFHRANGLSDQRVFKLALGDRPGRETLVMPTYAHGVEEEQTATLQRGSWQEREPNVSRIEIECTTLDEFAGRQALPDGFCCLKIDVENFEAAVLRGARDFIGKRRPWIVCELLPGQRIDPVTGQRSNDNGPAVTQLTELGYIPFAIVPEGFFRMSPGDFSQSRGVKDFLLLPVEAMPAGASYLAASAIQELLPPS